MIKTLSVVILALVVGAILPWEMYKSFYKGNYGVGECVYTGNYSLYRIVSIGKHDTYILESESGIKYHWSTRIKGGFTRTDCMEEFK